MTGSLAKIFVLFSIRRDATGRGFYFFTVQEQKTRKKDHIAKQLHSTYISGVKIYKADQSLSDPRIITRVERETVGSDDKLMRIIAKIKSNSENSSDKL